MAHAAYGQQQAYAQPQPAAAATDPGPVEAWFEAIDTDRSGKLDAKELQKALELAGLKFSLSDVDLMVRAFDTKGSRGLSMPDFTKLHQFINSVTQSFQWFDLDRSGNLQKVEVMQALRHAGFTMEDAALQAMFTRFDPDNSNALSLDEFIRMSLFVQSCVRAFSAFDSQRQGRITLDFNQFLYAASHI